jgi:hypothetical protein
MILELNENERQIALACFDAAIKHAANSMQVAAIVLPLAAKLQALKEDEKDGNSNPGI